MSWAKCQRHSTHLRLKDNINSFNFLTLTVILKKTKQKNNMLAVVQNLTAGTHTRWRDLLFYIKKGANWSFPLHVEGIKSDFIRFICETLFPGGGKQNSRLG